MSKHLKNIGVVSLLTVASRVLGLMRDQLSGAVFGDNLLNSAFLTAFRLPNLFRRLLGEGALTAAFLPTLQDELHEHGRPGAFALLNKVVSWLAVVTGGLVLVAMLLFRQSRLIPAQEDRWYLVADLTVILFPYLAFICVAAAFNATLNVFQHFTEPTLSPIWLNLAMIFSLGGAAWYFAPGDMGTVLLLLCGGVLIGGFLQMAVPAVVLMRLGWRPQFDLILSPRVREIARLMTPGFFGTAIYQVNIYVASLLAYSLNDSAGTLLFYSNRLMELPIGVFAVAVSTVVYPLIARHATERKFTELAEDYRRGVRLILIINLPAAAGLALLSGPIVRLLYEHGKFDAAAAQAMTPLLTLFAIGLPFFSITGLTVRAFYALKDTGTPVRIALVDFLVNLILSVSLMHWLGAAGLVLASTAAIIVQTLLLQRALVRKLPGMSLVPLWPTLVKVGVASFVMGVLVWGGWQIIGASVARPRFADALAVLGLIPVAVAAYAWLMWLLRVEGYDVLLAMLRRKRGA